MVSVFRRCEPITYEVECALSPRMVDMWDDSLWFSNDATRQQAQAILRDTPEGTFLVRYLINK